MRDAGARVTRPGRRRGACRAMSRPRLAEKPAEPAAEAGWPGRAAARPTGNSRPEPADTAAPATPAESSISARWSRSQQRRRPRATARRRRASRRREGRGRDGRRRSENRRRDRARRGAAGARANRCRSRSRAFADPRFAAAGRPPILQPVAVPSDGVAPAGEAPPRRLPLVNPAARSRAPTSAPNSAGTAEGTAATGRPGTEERLPFRHPRRRRCRSMAAQVSTPESRRPAEQSTCQAQAQSRGRCGSAPRRVQAARSAAAGVEPDRSFGAGAAGRGQAGAAPAA